MYEIILKWSLESLTKLSIAHEELSEEEKKRQHAVLLEAIKTKNAMALKRFEYALLVSDELSKIQKELALSLVDFKNDMLKAGDANDWGKEKIEASSFMEEIHKPFMRSFLDTRNKFEPINDLFSLYSIEAQRILDHDEMIELAQKKFDNKATIEDFCNFYFSIFGHVLGTLAALVRISSDDLRFWLVELPYSDVAEEFARSDFINMRKALLSSLPGETYRASLETREGLRDFWNEVAKLNVD